MGSRKNATRKNIPWKIDPLKMFPLTKCPQENCPSENCPHDIFCDLFLSQIFMEISKTYFHSMCYFDYKFSCAYIFHFQQWFIKHIIHRYVKAMLSNVTWLPKQIGEKFPILWWLPQHKNITFSSFEEKCRQFI